MYQKKIFLKDLDHVKHFVEMTAKYDKLIIGIVSLDIREPITLEVPDEEPPAQFLEDIEKFAYTEK